MKMKLAIFALSVASIFARSPSPTMKAIVAHQWGGPEVLKLEDLAIPTLKENEMLIKVFASGVNSFDGMLLTGKYAKIGRTLADAMAHAVCRCSHASIRKIISVNEQSVRHRRDGVWVVRRAQTFLSWLTLTFQIALAETLLGCAGG